jgi:transposase-like protein
MDKVQFDFEAFKKHAANRLKKGDTLLGKDGVLTPLLKEFLEGALEGELEAHIEDEGEGNRKNGKGRKQVKTPIGSVEINPPRDRNSTFEAERNLGQLEANWGQRYPKVIESWRKNWPRLSSYFQYNKDVRRIMYTTNIIEGFHRQLRAVTKSKGAFQSEDALMKLLFLVQENICAKWNKPVHNWNQTLAQLSIIFGDRLKLNL